MAKTLAQYKTIVTAKVEDNSDRAEAIIEEGIHEIYQQICLFTAEYINGTTEENINAIVNQRWVMPANDYLDIKNVLWKEVGSDTFNLLGENFTEDEYYKYWVNVSASNPTKYYINGNKIYFNVDPSNAGTVKISGVERVAPLSGTALSILPNEYDSVLILGVVAFFKAYEGLPDALEYYSQYHGRFFDDGRVGGQLKIMIDELRVKSPIVRPGLYSMRS